MPDSGVLLQRLRAQGWFALARAAQILMETTLLALWYQGIARQPGLAYGKVWLVLGGCFLGSAVLAWLLSQDKIAAAVRQTIFLGWVALTAVASLRLLLFPTQAVDEIFREALRFFTRAGASAAAVAHVVVLVLLTLRGVALARGAGTLRAAQVAFQLALIWLLLYGLALAPAHPREAALGLFLILYFGMASMAAARFAQMGAEAGGRAPRLRPGWLATIFLSSLGVVGLALAAGWLLSSRLVLWIISALAFVFTMLSAVLLTIFGPLFHVVARALRDAFMLLRDFFSRSSGMGLPGVLENAAEQLSILLGKLIPLVISARGWIFLLFLVGMALILFYRLRFGRSADASRDEDAPEQAGAPRPRLPRLEQLLPKRFRRLRSPAQVLAAAQIRQIYRQLMHLSSSLGQPRAGSMTPLEFLAQLDHLFPAQPEDLRRITAAYLQVRYGEYPETRAEVEAVRAAWERLRKTGRHRKTTGRLAAKSLPPGGPR